MNGPRLHLPTFDLGELERGETVAALDIACRRYGVFALTGHDLSEPQRMELFAAARLFFGSDAVTKEAVRRTADNPWGYNDAELTKNTRDLKEVFDYGPPTRGHETPWPQAEHRAFRVTVLATYVALFDIALRLLRVLAANLSAPEALLTQAFDDDHTSFLRLNHYPACARSDQEESSLGVHPHTDAGALTLLLHDGQPALQTLVEGVWHRVSATPDRLIVNLGDILQVWSNDRYVAPLHRVVSTEKGGRISAPFFLNPSHETVYAPLSSQATSTRPAQYRPIQWGAFRERRAAGDYADLGPEVQISDFRLDSD